MLRHWSARMCLLLAVAGFECTALAQQEAPSDRLLRRAARRASPTIREARNETAAALRLERLSDLRPALAEADEFKLLKEGLPSLEIDGQKFFVAEGDLLLDEDELLLYADVRKNQRELYLANQRAGLLGPAFLAGPRPTLVGILDERGKLVRWAPGTALTYCVLKGSFNSTDRYNLVRQNFLQATTDWERLCGVDFQYLEELDAASNSSIPAGAVFVVRGINANGSFIASAFFPNDPPDRRKVLVDPSYFTTSFDKVGVFRHELGHVLGFRHEHIRSEAPAACPGESTDHTINLTDYDPQSVMHYFCGGVGRPELEFTPIDQDGALQLYGPPFGAMTFYNP